MCVSKPSRVLPSGARIAAALLQRMSSREWRFENSSANLRTEARSATSSCISSRSALGTRFWMSSIASRPLACVRQASTTLAPAPARPNAISKPRPRLAPVTIAVLPASEGISTVLQFGFMRWLPERARSLAPNLWRIVRSMKDSMHRRDLLKGVAALGWLPAVSAAVRDEEHFDLAWLKGRARFLAQSPYVAPSRQLPDGLAAMTYDQFQAIHDRPERALWADHGLDFQVQFFHPGYTYLEPVRVHEVVDGKARTIAYDPALFDFGKSGINARHLPKDLGFAGVRIRYHADWKTDLVAFLGASYFRAVGASRQFGMSARGLAIDVATDHAEEFPRFTEFWLERPAPKSGRL